MAFMLCSGFRAIHSQHRPRRKPTMPSYIAATLNETDQTYSILFLLTCSQSAALLATPSSNFSTRKAGRFHTKISRPQFKPTVLSLGKCIATSCHRVRRNREPAQCKSQYLSSPMFARMREQLNDLLLRNAQIQDDIKPKGSQTCRRMHCWPGGVDWRAFNRRSEVLRMRQVDTRQDGLNDTLRDTPGGDLVIAVDLSHFKTIQSSPQVVVHDLMKLQTRVASRSDHYARIGFGSEGNQPR